MMRGMSLALVAGWLAASGPAWALPPSIQDKAGIFTNPAEVEKANQGIQDIKKQFGKYLVVETLKKPPSWIPFLSNAGKVKTMDPAAREQYFATLAKNRVHPNSILVLVCQDPLEVQVAVGRGADLQQAFGKAEMDQLRQLFLTHLTKKEADQALVEGISFVHQTLEERAAKAVDTSFPWLTILEPILVILGIWLVIEMVRTFRGRDPEMEGVFDPDPQGSGGSILTGLFATMAGHYRRPAMGPPNPVAEGSALASLAAPPNPAAHELSPEEIEVLHLQEGLAHPVAAPPPLGAEANLPQDKLTHGTS